MAEVRVERPYVVPTIKHERVVMVSRDTTWHLDREEAGQLAFHLLDTLRAAGWPSISVHVPSHVERRRPLSSGLVTEAFRGEGGCLKLLMPQTVGWGFVQAAALHHPREVMRMALDIR